MAYNSGMYMPYVPQGYGQQPWQQYQQPFAVPQMTAPQLQQQEAHPAQDGAQPKKLVGDFVFEVFGREGAEALPIGANSKVIAFDKEADIMYRIQTDDAEVKNVLEFDFSPRSVARRAETPPDGQYATKEDIEALRAEIDALKHPAASKPTRTVTRKAGQDGE